MPGKKVAQKVVKKVVKNCKRVKEDPVGSDPLPVESSKDKVKTHTSPLIGWDFRISASCVESENDIINQLKIIAREWVFQKEKGTEAGYEHYQGRFKLIKKHRKAELLKLFTNISAPQFLEPTVVKEFKGGKAFYMMKEETRIAGPWKDNDVVEFMPYQFQGIFENLRPYQKFIFDDIKIRESRMVNYIYDVSGNCGKSSLAAVMEIKGFAIDLPPVNDFKSLMEIVCNICQQKGPDPKAFFIDLPRSLNKSSLYELYTGIEQIKKGKLYDSRYHYKWMWIHSPQIWVFSNSLPDMSALTADRWKMWKIDADYQIQPLTQKMINQERKSIRLQKMELRQRMLEESEEEIDFLDY